MAKRRTDAELCLIIQKNHPSHRKKAWQELLERHNGLLRQLAAKYLIREIPEQDMLQEAIRGMRYSCTTFIPGKSMFTTHMGWGVMKFCLAYRKKILEATREKIISQSKDMSEKYFATPRKVFIRKQLSGAGFEKISQLAKACKCSKEDILMLRLSLLRLGMEERKQIRRKLFNHWMEQRIRKVCKQITSYYHEQNNRT